jgi:hypothetical protein
MYFKPVLATTKVTPAHTFYIRFASKIEGQHFHRLSVAALSRTFL